MANWQIRIRGYKGKRIKKTLNRGIHKLIIGDKKMKKTKWSKKLEELYESVCLDDYDEEACLSIADRFGDDDGFDEEEEKINVDEDLDKWIEELADELHKLVTKEK
ncbi:MAG: hypothetical protein RXR31_08675 [Thermoproteota archaeon]